MPVECLTLLLLPLYQVRLKIVGTRVDASEIVRLLPPFASLLPLVSWSHTHARIQASKQANQPLTYCTLVSLAICVFDEQFAIGSIKEDYLGLIS
jgi:hypothetical protein